MHLACINYYCGVPSSCDAPVVIRTHNLGFQMLVIGTMLLGEMAGSGVEAGNTQDEPTASYRHQRESVLKITAKHRMEAC